MEDATPPIYGLHGTAVMPQMKFHMAVGKNETAAVAMIPGRAILQYILTALTGVVHNDIEYSVIDAFGMWFRENPDVGWPRTHNLVFTLIGPINGSWQKISLPERAIHGIGPNSRHG